MHSYRGVDMVALERANLELTLAEDRHHDGYERNSDVCRRKRKTRGLPRLWSEGPHYPGEIIQTISKDTTSLPTEFAIGESKPLRAIALGKMRNSRKCDGDVAKKLQGRRLSPP